MCPSYAILNPLYITKFAAGWQEMVYSNMLAKFWQTFFVLAIQVTNVKSAGSLKIPKSSAGWESDNFNILLAGGEEWVFFLGKFS